MSVAIQRTTYTRVQKVLCEQLQTTEKSIMPQASLYDDLNADSLDIVQIVMGLEEEFDVSLGENVPTLPTVQDIVDYMDGVMQAE